MAGKRKEEEDASEHSAEEGDSNSPPPAKKAKKATTTKTSKASSGKGKEEEDASEHSAEEGGSNSPPPAKKAKKATTTKKSEDKKPKTSKASSKASKGGIGKGVYTNTESEKYIDLGRKKRVTVRNYKGMTQIDIREYYDANGEEKPGKKGISLNPEQWTEFKQYIATIDDLVKNLK